MTPRRFVVARYSARVWCTKTVCFWHLIAGGMANTKQENAHTFQAQNIQIDVQNAAFPHCGLRRCQNAPYEECHIHTDFQRKRLKVWHMLCLSDAYRLDSHCVLVALVTASSVSCAMP